MIEQYLILDKAEELLRNSPDLQNIDAVILQSEEVNENPNISPWIGVYPGETDFEPARAGNVWRNIVNFSVTVQTVNSRDGNVAEKKINELERFVIKAIMQDTSVWSSLLDMITGIKILPGIRESEEGTVFFRESIITFTGFVEERLF